MSLLSILVLMLTIHDHRFKMVSSINSMCLQSSSWQISSRRLRLAPIISFTSPNLVLLIHHEFEGSIRCVIGFLLLYFSKGFSIYFSPPVHVYIWTSVPHMNTSGIHNIRYTDRPWERTPFPSSSSPSSYQDGNQLLPSSSSSSHWFA
jgi:hypothetical protein